MKYFLMAQKVESNGTIIYKRSHRLVELKTGLFLPRDFQEPLVCELDDEHLNSVMPTFYMSPAIIGTRQFYNDLVNCGVDNIEVKSVVINDPVNNKANKDYLLLNIIGRVSCADMGKSEYGNIHDDMNIIDKLVIDPKKAHGLNLFLVQEDTDCIVVNEYVHKCLMERGYTDIHFEELEQS